MVAISTELRELMESKVIKLSSDVAFGFSDDVFLFQIQVADVSKPVVEYITMKKRKERLEHKIVGFLFLLSPPEFRTIANTTQTKNLPGKADYRPISDVTPCHVISRTGGQTNFLHQQCSSIKCFNFLLI